MWQKYPEALVWAEGLGLGKQANHYTNSMAEQELKIHVPLQMH